MIRTPTLLAPALAMALAACSSVSLEEAPQPTRPATAQAAVVGEAQFLERIALPPDAVFEATLQDVSRAGAAAPVLSSDRQTDARGPVFVFRIPYDAAAIDPRRSYGVHARVTVDGQLWFTTDTAAPVLTRGAGQHVTLRLIRKADGAVAAASAPLLGTRWQLVQVAGQPAARAGQGDGGFVQLQPGGEGQPTLRADFGCNSVSGVTRVNGDRLEAGALTATLMACPPPLDAQERQMLDALAQPLQWRITGREMVWRSAEGRPLAVFEASAP